MYSIKIYLQGSGIHSEVTFDDLHTAELLVENIVSQALLELFEELEVQEVIVTFSPLEQRHPIAFPPF